MKNGLENIDKLLRLEVERAVRFLREAGLSLDDEERQRQDKASKAVKARELQASDKNEKDDVAEAEDDIDSDEAKSKDSDVEKREDRTGGKGTAQSSKAKMPNSEDFQNPTLSNVIDKVNIVRGGKSLKDPEVKKSFETYFESLTLQEKQALLIFLTGMAQVLVGTKEGAEAPDPGEVGLRVKSQAKQKSASPTTPGQKKQSTGTADSPIVVGEQQNKDGTRRILELHRRH